MKEIIITLAICVTIIFGFVQGSYILYKTSVVKACFDTTLNGDYAWKQEFCDKTLRQNISP